MLEINFRWADLHESGDGCGGRRSDEDGASPVLRNAHVLLRVDVCVFVGEFDPGQPVPGKRNRVAKLNIGSQTRFVSAEVEKGAAFLPLGDQTKRRVDDIYGAGYALK